MRLREHFALDCGLLIFGVFSHYLSSCGCVSGTWITMGQLPRKHRRLPRIQSVHGIPRLEFLMPGFARLELLGAGNIRFFSQPHRDPKILYFPKQLVCRGSGGVGLVPGMSSK